MFLDLTVGSCPFAAGGMLYDRIQGKNVLNSQARVVWRPGNHAIEEISAHLIEDLYFFTIFQEARCQT